jgi:hypothetical protein
MTPDDPDIKTAVVVTMIPDYPNVTTPIGVQ